MGDDNAIDVLAVGQFGDTPTQLQQVFVGNAFRGDLHHLFAADVGQLAELRYASDQFSMPTLAA